MAQAARVYKCPPDFTRVNRICLVQARREEGENGQRERARDGKRGGKSEKQTKAVQNTSADPRLPGLGRRV
eukprot:7055862-Pyramimonas_sp.AAC.1